MKINKKRLFESIGLFVMLIGFSGVGFFIGIGYNGGDLNVNLFGSSLAIGLIGAVCSPMGRKREDSE